MANTVAIFFTVITLNGASTDNVVIDIYDI